MKNLVSNHVILHADMDAFFASVEQSDQNLHGKPVIVGSPPDQRGVVSAASYEARKFGVRSAMPSQTAYKLCPNGIFLPPRMERYKEVSNAVMEIFYSITPEIEQISVDEAFLDVTGCKGHFSNIKELVSTIQNRVRNELGLTVSIGVAPNKFLAKIASDMNKPDGVTYVPFTREKIINFLAPLPVERIWGVGKTTAKILHQHHLRTIHDLQKIPDVHLSQFLTPHSAQRLKQLAFGIDNRTVGNEEHEKSISNETTFSKDCADEKKLEQVLIKLIEKVGRRTRAAGFKSRTINLKLRNNKFKTITRSKTLKTPTASDRFLLEAGLEIFKKNYSGDPIRLIGFGLSNLVDENWEPEPERQLNLFDAAPPEEKTVPKEDPALDSAVDKIRRQFGNNSLKRGM